MNPNVAAGFGAAGGLGLGGLLHGLGNVMNEPRRMAVRGLAMLGDTIGLVPGGAESGEGTELIRHLFRQAEPSPMYQLDEPSQELNEPEQESDPLWVRLLGELTNVGLDPVNLIPGAVGAVSAANMARKGNAAGRLGRVMATTERVATPLAEMTSDPFIRSGTMGTRFQMPLAKAAAPVAQAAEAIPEESALLSALNLSPGLRARRGLPNVISDMPLSQPLQGAIEDLGLPSVHPLLMEALAKQRGGQMVLRPGFREFM